MTPSARVVSRVLVGVVSLAAALHAAVASDVLLPGRLIPYSTGPRDFGVGDFDGDGRPDMLVLGGDPGSIFFSPGVTLLRGRGDATFEARRASSDGIYGSSPLLIDDINDDGRLDAILSTFLFVGPDFRGGVSVLLGNGDGTFAPTIDTPVGPALPFFVATGNFNGDRSRDLIALTEGEKSCNQFGCSNTLYYMWILLGTGDGRFAPPIRMTSEGAFPNQVAVADFNGDGLDDLAVADYLGNVGTNHIGVVLFLGRGDGTFQDLGDVAPQLQSSAVRAGDLDHDGRPDLVVDSSLPGDFALHVLLGTGDGHFAAPIGYPTGAPVFGFFLADLNGDGAPDLSVAHAPEDEVVVLLNAGDGSFARTGSYLAGHAPMNFGAADFNGDGRIDLAVGATGQSDLNYGDHLAGPHVISLLLGKGGGAFASASVYPTGPPPSSQEPIGKPSLASGDLDRNGLPDLVTADTSSNNVSVLLGRPDGALELSGRFATGQAPTSIAVGDFDGDGRPDVATGNSGSLSLSLLLGDGTGALAPAAGVPLGYAPTSIAAGDFNRDGRADLAVVTPGASRVAIYTGQQNGTLAGPTFFAAPAGPYRLSLADVNGDGAQDIVAVHGPAGGTVSLLLGRGDATFSAGQIVAVLPNRFTIAVAIAVAIADLDGDGDQDLAVLDQNNWNAHLFMQSPSGLFQDTVTLPAGFFPGSIAAGDLNGDGRPDLVVANESPFSGVFGFAGDLSIFLQGPEGGFFGDSARYAAGARPHALLLADFNSDGTLDIAAAAGAGVSVLLNERDVDHDGIADARDACVDSDGDGSGDPDVASNTCRPDNCPATANPGQEDTDADGRGDACDNCPGTPNPEQSDTNEDGSGDACQPTLRLLGIVHDGDRLRVSIAAADPNGDPLTGRVTISASEPADVTFENVFETHDCGQVFLPEGIEGEGIAFVTDGFLFAFLDVASVGRELGLFCDPPGARSYGFATARCDDLGPDPLATFVVFENSNPLPLALCAVKLDADGGFTSASPRFDFTVQSVSATEAVVTTARLRTLTFDFTPGQTQTFDISSLVHGTAAHMTIEVTDGNTIPATIDTAFPYQGERALVLESGAPPQAVITTQPVVECDRAGGAEVTLDGSRSSDPSLGEPITSFEWFADPGTAGERRLGSGALLRAILPLGSTTIELRIATAGGRTGAARTRITVADTTAPSLALAADPAILWPPNHRMVPVRVTIQATDRCDPAATVRLTSATSSEPDDAAGDGDGRTTGDVSGAEIGTPDSEIMLRSERSTNGAGRTYRLTYAASDASGNSASALTIVTVPGDQGRGPEPLEIGLEPDGARGTVRLFWNSVAGALGYDIISGDVAGLKTEQNRISLGFVRVPARLLTATSWSEETTGSAPETGRAFFFLVQFRDANGPSGFGTESSPLPLEPDSCEGGCPGKEGAGPPS